MSAALSEWSLLRRIWCGATSASTSTSSSPVETTATFGDWATVREGCPHAAATAISRPVSLAPARTITSPALWSEPRRWTLPPGGEGTAWAATIQSPSRPRRGGNRLGRDDPIPLARRLLAGDDAVGALREDGPRHDLDARLVPGAQRERPHARRLGGLHAEPRNAPCARRRAERKPVHGPPVERRQVAVGPQVAPQDPAMGLGDRAVLLVEERNGVEDQLLGGRRGEHAARVIHKSRLAE